MARVRNEEAYSAKRKEILRAAEALFVQHGFHQTGMAAICAAAGMSPGALYRYFPSKVAIIRAIVEEERADAVAMFERVARARRFRPALVEALCDAIIAVSEESYARIAVEIAAEGGREPEVREILVGAQKDLLGRLTLLIEGAKASGAAATDIDSEATARLLLMIVDGATSPASVATKLSRKRLSAALARVVDALLDSVALSTSRERG
jgi:AcrR family transcriptional regulator